MCGTTVYTNTAIASTDGEISINHHTSAIHVFNSNSSTDATIKLNGIHQIVIPHTPVQSTGHYICIPGDYTKIEVVTTGVTLSVFAVG